MPCGVSRLIPTEGAHLPSEQSARGEVEVTRMSVAKCLGLDDVSGPGLAVAAVAWESWCHLDPDLAVVDDLMDLPDWTRRAPVAAKDGLLVRLHRKAQDDAEAATVLAWLLL